MTEQWTWLIPLLPGLSAVWIGIGLLGGWNRGERGEWETAQVASWAVALALGVLLLLDGQAILTGAAPGSIRLFPWMETTGYRVMIGFTLDRLGLAMTTLAAVLAWLTVRFSVHYLHREAGFQRFFALLSLFVAALLLFLMAGSATLAFVGWEIMGLTSYLLIGFAYERGNATRNATRVFMTNRVGDAGFTVGMLLSFTWLGGSEWTDLVRGVPLLDSFQVGIMTGGFVLAALVKSGQMPFAAWLGRSLEGPTPSSAIFYGALMVHAGVFLLLRLEQLIAHSPFLMVVLVLLGSLTVVYGALVGSVQTDVKSALICATQTQVGLMFVACGLGWFNWAAWHLAAHAGWRAYQWLSAPGYMHGLHGPTPPVWGEWQQQRPGVFAAALARFWLDPVTDRVLTRPVFFLARDIQSLDDRLVNRLMGSHAMDRILFGPPRPPRQLGAQWVAGVGLLGRLLERVGRHFQWVEERILDLGGDGMVRLVAGLGAHLARIDELFSEPRYLVLMIILTFVAIL
ncbi:MAG: hypothetical protein HQL87_01020 [Magnetococcales bacterium]|nr:hypothetical protein [Magnetococcales bacterium]